MKIKAGILILCIILQTNLYAVVDPSGPAQRAQMIFILQQVASALRMIRVVNQSQSKDIESIFRHYERLDKGDDFLEIASAMGYEEELTNIYDTYDDVEIVKKTIGDVVSDVRDIPEKSIRSTQRIEKIIETRRKIGTEKQSSAVKRGVEYESISAENTEEIKDYQKQALAVTKKNEREKEEDQERADEAFKVGKENEKRLKKFYKDFSR